jgi:oligoribonuclease (3'-5' exoribonuclease)
MVKTSKNQVKTDEQKIIQTLKQNSNESINDIAKNAIFQDKKYGE